MKTQILSRFIPLFVALLTLFCTRGISSRPIPSELLISDGVDELKRNPSDHVILMKGSIPILMHANDEKCEQMYGFLPCSTTVWGHLFLILVFEYLLFAAESYVGSGGEMIFKILGPGVFGACVFQIIGSLPEALILLASGLSSSEELAGEFVLTGVGLLAGSTILLLTLIWGTCILLSSQYFGKHLQSHPNDCKSYNPFERLLISQWPGYGVITDLGTSFTARIMLLSVIPLAIILIPTAFHLPFYGQQVFVIITLVVSIMFLISYFFYQFFQPWIQRRRLLYIKHEHLVVDILKYMQNQTMGKLLTDDGSPNVSTIRRLFEERDQDGDKVISFSELNEFLQEIKFRRLESNKDDTTAEIMQEFDIDNDQKITMDEFVKGMTKWLDDTKDTMNKRYHSVKSLKDLYEVLKPWVQKKREEREMMKHLVPDILEHLQSSVYGSLLEEDGSPDIPAIKRLFKDVDLDQSNSISYSELKKLVTNIQVGMFPGNADIAAAKMMEELDINGDQLITEEEFVIGLSKWLNITYNQNLNSEKSEEENYQKTWEQTDKLIDDKFVDKSPIAWMKAIFLLALGIVMLGVLAEPLIHSVRDISKATNLPSFYVSFVLVPIATNARLAVSAIREARRKKLHTISLTLSEIYGTVFMNNILGLAVLLALIYFRGLAWNFSAESSMVLFVSVIVGCLASFSTIFPVWTSLLAYLLYPLSLVIVYSLGDFDWFSYIY
ncbi:sodium/calcium exchanger NCL2-like [Primulina huaijiensis]|uniref:sodium/calcium exchanger NCL2-like n=1 Tax=Primulina huaijiensis TaxID=1492673 RepID=UPI003CC7902E